MSKVKADIISQLRKKLLQWEGYKPADARATVAGLATIDDTPGKVIKLLRQGLWCIRYTPIVAVDLPGGLILDISGCSHLWDGERLCRTNQCSGLSGATGRVCERFTSADHSGSGILVSAKYA